jgi:thioredoxin 1
MDVILPMKPAFLYKPAFLLALLLSVSSFDYRQEKAVTLKAYYESVKDNLVLVYFSASWCNVCGKFKPVIAQVEKDYAGKVKLLRIDTERDKEVSEEFDVNTLPLLMLYKNGKLVWTNSGITELATLSREIDCYLQ